jgi:hypothetical protein
MAEWNELPICVGLHFNRPSFITDTSFDVRFDLGSKVFRLRNQYPMKSVHFALMAKVFRLASLKEDSGEDLEMRT